MNKNERLERWRLKLNDTVDRQGLRSEQTQKISNKLDRLINEQYEHEVEYPEHAIIKENYYECIVVLKDTLKDVGRFPTTKEWNKYAQKNKFLSHISIEYISKMTWNELEKFIRLELKNKI